VASHSPVSSPEPSWTLVVVVPPPQVPVGTHILPMALVVFIEHASTVSVHANTFEPAPCPACASMELVIVSIATVEVPVSANTDPT
jgi:hypothetical protein